ncbi:RluA family pseudouridine synthase [Fructilactobacillus fructivorans]|nr:RluA family pseudouridine synthase [Fructilactobacillus fructivorans]
MGFFILRNFMKNWKYQLIVPNIAETTVREYLHEYLLIPKHLIFSLRKAQRVLVNGSYRPMNFPIHTGDRVMLDFIPADFQTPFPHVIPDATKPLKVAYENEDLLIVNKNRGDKTHANQPGEVGTTLNQAENYLQPAADAHMVHRLDQQTSGALIIGKNPAVVPILVRMIKDKTVKRTYLAWVHGRLNQPTGVINDPIGRDPNDRRKRKINGVHAQSALTNYRVVQSGTTSTLVSLQLQTGRTHQIRVHLASIGHPIINDPLYDPNAQPGHPMLLHSWKIKMLTPFYYQPLAVSAPLPPKFNM